MRSRFFLILSILLVGCGGRYHSQAATPDLGLPALGAASLDLTLTGASGVVQSDAMKGTKMTKGALYVTSLTPNAPGWLAINAVLRRMTPNHQAVIQQQFALQIVHFSALRVGATYDLAAQDIKPQYIEGSGVPVGGDFNSLPKKTWGFTSGTVEVTSVSDQAIGLRFTNMTFLCIDSPDSEPLTISGTLSGPVTRSE